MSVYWGLSSSSLSFVTATERGAGGTWQSRANLTLGNQKRLDSCGPGGSSSRDALPLAELCVLQAQAGFHITEQGTARGGSLEPAAAQAQWSQHDFCLVAAA